MRKNKFIAIIIATILLLTACDLDINDNPNKTTVGELHLMLPNAQRGLGYTFTLKDYLGGGLSAYVGHLNMRESDNYSMLPGDVSISNTWAQAYADVLTNVEAIIEEADAKKYTHYAGIGKLMKAYLYAQMVDLWGSIPYTEACIIGNITPKKDTDKDIYNALLVLIDEALLDLKELEKGEVPDPALNLLEPASDDVIYGGDFDKWRRMGNTLKLKLLVNSRKAKSDIPNWDAQLAALLTKNKFLQTGADFELRHFKIDNPEQRNPAYVDEYAGTQQTKFISPWIYETMKGMTLNVKDNPFEGILDPRIPYYWINQSKESSVAQDYTDYRDGAFISIFFGSKATGAGNNQSSSSSRLGIYAAGGKFDDGNGGTISDRPSFGANAPSKMIQSYSVPFMLAELYLTNQATGDAKKALEEGITESIKHVNTVSQTAKGTANVPNISVEDEKTKEFLTKVLAKYDAATSAELKLKIVMTQKWIANYFNPVEAYTDYRRTGYPTQISPTVTTAISPYYSTPKPVVGPMDIPLKTIAAYPRVLWYPTDETTSNPNMSNADRNVTAKVLFWDK